MGNCFPVAAIEGRGDADIFLVVATDVKAVEAPSGVWNWRSSRRKSDHLLCWHDAQAADCAIS